MRLHRAGKTPLILLSGGAAVGFPAEPELMAGILKELGVPEGAMLLEIKSRNTRQNGIYPLEIMEAQDVNRG